MKRFLSLTLVAVMLLSTLMLTSCDPVGDTKNFFNKIFGKEDVVELRTTITEEEWAAIYQIDNYTISGQDADTYISLKVAHPYVSLGARIDMDSYNYEQSIIADIENQCVIMDSEVGYLGFKGYNIFDDQDFSFDGIGIFDGYQHSDLVYDETTGRYTLINDDTVYEFRFENGALKNLVISPVDTDIEGKFEFTNIESTVIEVGEYEIINDGKVSPSKAAADVVTTITEEELRAVLQMENFTLVGATGVVMMPMTIIMKADGYDLSLEANVMGEQMSQYITTVDGTLYSIEQYAHGFLATSTGYTVEEIEKDLADLNMGDIMDVLVYNEEGRYYELDMEQYSFCFFFENGQLVKVVAIVGDGFGAGSTAPMSTEDQEKIEIIFLVKDVGTTDVQLPLYAIDE